MRDMIIPDAVHALDRELRGIFGARLQSLSIYGARPRAAAHAHGTPTAHGQDAAPRLEHHAPAIEDDAPAPRHDRPPDALRGPPTV